MMGIAGWAPGLSAHSDLLYVVGPPGCPLIRTGCSSANNRLLFDSSSDFSTYLCTYECCFNYVMP